jgi:hypothetical protein
MLKQCFFLFFSLTNLFGTASLFFGYRSDSLDWKRGGLGQHFDSQRLFNAELKGSWRVKKMVFEINGNLSTLLAGTFYSTEPLHRFEPLSPYGLAPQKKATPHGYTGRVEASIGYPSKKNTFILTPLFGVSYFHQNLFTKTLSTKTYALINGELFDLKAQIKQSLKTDWTGPFLGAHLLFAFDSCINLFGKLTFHFDNFKGTAKKESFLSSEGEEKITSYLKKNTVSTHLETGINACIKENCVISFAIDYAHLFQNELLRYHALNFKLGMTKTF